MCKQTYGLIQIQKLLTCIHEKLAPLHYETLKVFKTEEG